jgi:hypothetical protein
LECRGQLDLKENLARQGRKDHKEKMVRKAKRVRRGVPVRSVNKDQPDLKEMQDHQVHKETQDHQVQLDQLAHKESKDQPDLKEMLEHQDQQAHKDHPVRVDPELQLLIRFLQDPTTMQQKMIATLESIAKSQQQYISQQTQKMEELLSSKQK